MKQINYITKERFNTRKEIILQNSTAFNDKNIKPLECIEILVDLMYKLNQGETFTTQEKETLFFSVSKLLHSANASLRRLIFLFVKHLNFWQNSFILTGSLISEINKSEELLKPNCFRLLGQIIDMSSVSVVERLLKTAISSQNAEIASSAVICTLFMVFKGFNVAKSWISEITDKLTTSIGQENLLTFHTLLLIKQIKANDKLFLIKIYSKLSESYSYKSQFAKNQLIRYISDILHNEELSQEVRAQFYAFLEKSIYNYEDSIKIEACRALLRSPKLTENLQKTIINVIRDLLKSSNNITRFAALRTLNQNISKISSSIVIELFFPELEKIIEDNLINSSIKAIALSILLKISKGLSDNLLEKMFKTFIEQYPTFKDDFKRDVVIISKDISKENSQKSKLYYNFFCSLFKLNANASTKLEILDALIWFVYNSQELKLQTIFFLAEFISDCQYEVVKIRILNLLGKECQVSAQPGKLIRYIVNQINLEQPMVRTSAISALAQIGFQDPKQRKTVIKYISRSFNDTDNDVRERAYFFYRGLKELEDKENNNKSKMANFIFPNNKTNPNIDIDILQSILKTEKDNLLKTNSISNELNSMLNDPEKISHVLLKNKLNETQSTKSSQKKTDNKKEQFSNNVDSSLKSQEDEYKKTMFNKIYGQPKIITPFKRLTDQTAEYLTSYRKIIHDKIVVIDFEITNTIELQLINKVSIEMDELESSGFDFDKAEIIEIEKLSTNQKGHLYLKIVKEEDEIYSSCNFKISLKFDLQELDVKGNPHGIAVKEQYKIDKTVEISYADYFTQNNKVTLNNFSEVWKMAENSNYHKKEGKMSLPYNSIKNAGKSFSEIIGLIPLNDLNKIDSNAKRFEFAYAYTGYLDNLLFLKFQVVMTDGNKCLAQVIILSQDENVLDLVLNKIYS